MILIEGKKIIKVGAGIPIPTAYKTVDYGNYWVYPGLINPRTSLGLSGIAMVREWNDYREKGKYNPDLSAYTAFYPWSNLIPITREFGTLLSLSAPAGGIVSGKAVLVSLDGWTPEDMFVIKEAALIIRLPESPRRRRRTPEAEKKPDFSKDKKELRSFVSRAYKYYLKSTQGKLKDYDIKLESMKDLWAKKLPVIISANTDKDIKYAIKLGKDFQLNVILNGVYDGEKVLKEIKKSGYPVILSSMYNTNRKWEDGCDKVFRLPGALFKEGIKFAFSAGSASTAFDLPIQAGRAVAYGLPRTEAVKALTLYPAEILGIKEYGSIEPGKVANLVIADGNILETSTVVKDVFINGKKVKGKSFFQKEFERARDKISGEMK